MDGLYTYALPAGWVFAGRAIEHGSRILVGATSDTAAPQLLLSEDGGATFTVTPWTLTAGPPLRFASNGSRIVAGTATAFYYSDDAGDTWTLGRNSVNSGWGVVSDGAGFAAIDTTNQSLWYSTEGSYWLNIPNSTLPMNRPVKLVGASGVMLLIGWHTTNTSKRIARSINSGTSWTNVVNDTWSGFFQDITFDGSLGIAVGGSSRIFRTTDAGLTWVDIGYSPMSTDLGAVLRNGSVVLVPTIYPPTMLRSTDSGQTWGHFSAAGAAFMNGGLLEGVVRAGRVYLYNRDGYLALAQNLAYSDDNGSTWTTESVAGVIDVLPAFAGAVVITNSATWYGPAAPPDTVADIESSFDLPAFTLSATGAVDPRYVYTLDYAGVSSVAPTSSGLIAALALSTTAGTSVAEVEARVAVTAISNALAASVLAAQTIAGATAISLVWLDVAQPGLALADVWAMNAETGGFTRYEGFDFNSYAKIGGAYFGCKEDGIYQLDGQTDAGLPIRSMVSFGKQDFGNTALKRITNAYVGVSGEGRLFLKVMGEGQEYTYAARNYDEALQVQRFDTGKGLRVNWLEFELYNADGEDFELASVEFAVVPTGRRI